MGEKWYGIGMRSYCGSKAPSPEHGRWPLAARHGHRLGPRDTRPRLRVRRRPAPRSPGDPTGYRDHGRALPHLCLIDRALRALGKHARAPTTHDSTRYGLSRSSPRTFLAHVHRVAISAAVVLADATTILLAGPAMSFKLTMGMSPF
jgi:hypothetical protein